MDCPSGLVAWVALAGSFGLVAAGVVAARADVPPAGAPAAPPPPDGTPAVGDAARGAPGAAARDAWVSPRPALADELAGRLRVFGAPGDPLLEGRDVVAVVRRSDGWLVDLWRTRPILPSAPQLGTEASADALWYLAPAAFFDRVAHPVVASETRWLEDGVEVAGVVEVVKVRLSARTRYRVAADAPRVSVETTWTVLSAADRPKVALGDEVRWGNVTHHVEGVTPPRLSYAGRARWVGRRGAGGDLLLRAASGAPFRVEYRARSRSSRGYVHALHDERALAPGEQVTVSRLLAFEPLPLPAPRVAAPRGTLELRVTDERGAPLPAKVRLDRVGDAKPPFEDDGDLDGADRFLWAGSGRTTRELPAGAYRALVTAGFERDATRHAFTLAPGGRAALEARLPRVVPTPGWLGADCHLHAAPSVDSDLSLDQRVIAVAAEGVELAVATDHYVVTDYAPVVARLRASGALAAELRTIPGSEVSTVGASRFGHFNVFPLPLDDNVRHRDVTATELFADARRAAPRGLLQVNHPWMAKPIGYFTFFGLDPATARAAVPGYEAGFDLLEVYNGDDAYSLERVRKGFHAWLTLSEQRLYAATGSSDSHNLAFLDPGTPRTYVRVGSSATDETDAAAPIEEVLAALAAGRSFVSSGPLLEVTARPHGQDAPRAGPGEVLRAPGGKVSVDVVVRAAPWVDVSEVEIFVQDERRGWAHVQRTERVERARRTFEVTVAPPSFVVVAAAGERGLPHTSQDGTRPFAFTNPIRVLAPE
ncbi:MAG: CehA/McbA family metallohydrolase [Polyangiaceae bacterium]|nr:CehA/McbA family metallohydrolase [Polyangiaceae bacterium]